MAAIPCYIAEKINEVSQESFAYPGGKVLYKFKVVVFYSST